MEIPMKRLFLACVLWTVACDSSDGKEKADGSDAGNTGGDGSGTTEGDAGSAIPVPDYSALSAACFSACEANIEAQCSCCLDYYPDGAEELCDTYCDVDSDALSGWCYACDEDWMAGTYESYVTYGYSAECLDAYFASMVESLECGADAFNDADCSDPVVGNSEAIEASDACRADAEAAYAAECG